MSALRGLVEGISTSGPERRAALTTEGVLVLAVAWAVHQGEVEGEAAWQLVVLALGFAAIRQWCKGRGPLVPSSSGQVPPNREATKGTRDE